MVAPSAAPAPSPPLAPGRPRRRWAFLATVAVVVVVVLVAVFALHLWPSVGSPSPNPYLTFSEAESTAVSGSGSVAGGPWYAVIGVALAIPTASLVPSANLTSILNLVNCSFTWPHGAPTNVAVPATGTSAPAGASAYWSFILKNATNDLVFETVSDGSASTLVLASGPECTEVAGALVSFPSAIVDSPKAITSANQVGGAAFLAAHPNATRAWVAIGGVSFFGIVTSPTWYVEYSSCAFPSAPTASGAVFNATVEGLTGVATNHTNGTADCALTVPTGFSLALPLGGPDPALGKPF